MHTFSTPCKLQKTVRFSDVFKGYRIGALGTNGLIKPFQADVFFLYLLKSSQSLLFSDVFWG